MMIEGLLIGLLTVTSYRPIASQTDASPTWTSIGDRTTKFGVAVSGDLLRSGEVKYGDVLYIEHFGYRIVNDTMAPRITRSVDLLVFTHAEEKRVGIRHLKVWVVKKPFVEAKKGNNHVQALSK